WSDSVGAAQVVTISQDIYSTKVGELAAQPPATCPAQTTTFPVNAYTYHTIGTGGSAKLYYCKQSNGCTGSPSTQSSQWQLIRSSC
ncbi:MAG TPA: hypothetical protein VLC08_00385, partial [Chitinolyticbacter sp.]|nr:hypothetical protein [Chitinolyticbacter sp.]